MHRGGNRTTYATLFTLFSKGIKNFHPPKNNKEYVNSFGCDELYLYLNNLMYRGVSVSFKHLVLTK